jgi:hypothetical protein
MLGSESQCIDALLNSAEFGQGRARRAHQLNSLAQGETSRLLNTLEVRLCRGGHNRRKNL